MNWDLLGAAALFGLVVAGTPGPANLSLMTMGATVGFRRSQRYLMGIWAGGLAVTALVGLGVGALLQAEPVVYRALQLAGFFYICWLAWQLAGMTGSGRTEAAQPSFWAGTCHLASDHLILRPRFSSKLKCSFGLVLSS